MKFETEAVHSGESNAHYGGAVCTPIFQSANFISGIESDYHRIKYIRLNNTPNHDVLHAKLAELERTEAALVTSSGMAAITTALFAVVKAGDHILAQECLYGGTVSFIQRDLKDLGVSVSWIDVNQPDTWKAQLKSNTKAIYVESIANPLTTVGELDSITKFAKTHGLVSLIDNTVASPYFFRPATIGFDLVLHSATKYLNGHSDIVAGAVMGSKAWIEKVKAKLDHFGGALDPHACFLLNRGIKTLALRMKVHQENALALAKFLQSQPLVERVYYPGLESHPGFKTAQRLFSGASGLLSFQLKGNVTMAERFLKALKIPLIAPSLGGVESLVTRPATTSHKGLTNDEREKIGISDSLIRVSVGIESAEDLCADFQQAMSVVK